MSDIRDIDPDDEREVPLDDEAEFELPPPTLDDRESVEADEDPAEAAAREAALEAGELPPEG